VQVWPVPEDIGANRDVALAASCSVKTACSELLRVAQRHEWNEPRPWLDTLRKADAEKRTRIQRWEDTPGALPHPARVARTAAGMLPPETLLVFDGGDFSGWARLVLDAVRPRGWQTSTMFGHLGTGLPYALGAKLASPATPVLLMTGDGALGFCAMEFETAVRHRIPVLVIVGNDRCWGVEDYFQQRRGTGCPLPMALSNVRWDLVMKAAGGHGEHVSCAAELRPALERAASSGGPACIDVDIARTPSPMAESYGRIFAALRARQQRACRPPGSDAAPESQRATP
jgi:thiamine pyrophosphate-dependent acetolactate synthase large subunit-like protein